MKKKYQHPSTYIEDFLIKHKKKYKSVRSLALALEVSPSTLTRLLNKEIAVSYEMAIKLSKIVGKKPLTWMTYQIKWDLQELHDVQ